MRKYSLAILLLLAFLLPLTACSSQSKPQGQLPKADAVLTGKITQLYDDTILLAGTGPGELYLVSNKLPVYDADGRLADSSALQAGQNLEIGYSGGIMESYPAQLGSPSYLKITGQGDDLVGLYQTVIKDLWNVDPGLNSGISILAFDLTKTANLSEGEKSSLVYVVSREHGVTGVTGTFNELSEQGYIDKEKLYFPEGMLITLELTEEGKDSFKFNATKWRGGTGAYFFHDCQAKKSGGSWSYTIGSQAIS